MKLIKLSTNHYIIVDDSEIKEGDWVFNEYQKQIKKFHAGSGIGLCRKITHSTQPLYKNDFWAIQELKLSEVKELLGEDVEKKAELNGHPESSQFYSYKEGFIDGYNQAIEDNKDKKYTEKDIVKAIEMAREGIRVTRISEWETEKEFDYNDYQIIQSLQPKTSWEVEFVDGKLKLKKL